MFYMLRHFLPIFLLLLIPTLAFGDLPNMETCNITTRATEDVSVMICPVGDGYAFSAAMAFGGEIVDATIEVYVRNWVGEPFPFYPRLDIWLGDPNLCFCPEGNLADFDTGTDGYSQFAFSLLGGGCSGSFELGGYLAGTPFIQNPLPHIRVNSPDLNCDLLVNLSDLASFAGAYFSGVTYCVDYYWDGVADLRDLAAFAQHYGHECHF